MPAMYTLGTNVLAALALRDGLEPTGLDTVKTTLAFDEVLAAEVNGPVRVAEADTTPATHHKDADKEHKHQKQESRHDHNERQQDPKHLAGVSMGRCPRLRELESPNAGGRSDDGLGEPDGIKDAGRIDDRLGHGGSSKRVLLDLAEVLSADLSPTTLQSRRRCGDEMSARHNQKRQAAPLGPLVLQSSHHHLIYYEHAYSRVPQPYGEVSLL